MQIHQNSNLIIGTPCFKFDNLDKIINHQTKIAYMYCQNTLFKWLQSQSHLYI